MNRHVLVQGITFSRILIASAVAVLAAYPDEWAVWVSVALVCVSEVTDIADGQLARKLGVVSSFGKMFDPFADSLSRIIVYWALGMRGQAWPFVFAVMAGRDVFVGYIRLNLAAAGRDVGARLTGKIKAVIQGACSIILMAGPLYWGMYPGLMEIEIPVLSSLVIFVTLLALADHLIAAWNVMGARGVRSGAAAG